MAIIEPIIGALRGKLGGVVFQRGRAGLVARAWVRGVDPHTDAQASARVRLSNAARTWHTLTDSQKADWETWAATGYSPRDGRAPGVSYTGFAAYSGQRQAAQGVIRAASPIIVGIDPPGVSVTTAAQGVPITAPSGVFGATWEIDGVSRPITAQVQSLNGLTNVELVISWAGGVTASSPPMTADQVSGEYSAIVVLVSLSSQQPHGWQPARRARLWVAVPPISGVTGWSPSDHLTLQLSPPPAILGALRNLPLHGMAARATVVAVSGQTGQQRIIGETTLVVT